MILALVNRKKTSAVIAASILMSIIASTDARSTPLTISGLTHEQLIPSSDCPSQVGGVTTGTGFSSLLGAVSLEARDCFSQIDNYFFFTGTMTFTMSDKDVFYADYEGLLKPTLYPSILVFADSVFTITGGTGRFLNASGEGILQGGQNIQTGYGLMMAIGEISNFKKNHNSSKPERSSARGADDEKSLNSTYGLTDVAALNALSDNPTSLYPTLADYYVDWDRQFLAASLPEATPISLLVIGLLSLVMIRGRQPSRLHSHH
jgi:hypothetical protein